MRTHRLDAVSVDLFASLIPGVTVIEIERTSAGLVLTALALAASATCPRCGTASTRVHSYYTRQPHDLPVCGLSVCLLLHVRRFRCIDPVCPAITFAERLPALVAPSAQRTTRLNAALRDLVLAVGGEAGARQSRRSAMPASSDTLLRRAHATISPAHPTPRMLGIDDFSFRKGQVFGTILTDGETHHVIDLLPDRTAETAAAWLHEHPGVEIITRDRSADYRRAISTGAPDAVQVADRFHLAKNAGETLERVIQRNHQSLALAARAVDQERAPTTPPATEAPQPPQPIPSLQTGSAPARSPAQQRRHARYQEVAALAAEGLGPTMIAQRVGLTRQTIARWLRTGSFPERAPSASRRRRMLITPYESYLRERWQAGEQNSRQLWRELRDQGFTGGCETVRRLTVRWRTERGRSGPPPKHPAVKPVARIAVPSAATRPLSPRQARWLLLKPDADLKPDQRQYLEHVGRACPEVVVAQQLILAFLQMLKQRALASLEPWLANAQASGLPELVEFAKGIVRDQDAVTAALQYEASNGITEGHVNRLKMIKRTAYGRASFELLRKRVLAQV
jgi:transposase